MKTSEAIKTLQELKFFKSESQALAIQHAIDFLKQYQWQPIETAPKDSTRILGQTVAGYILPIYWRQPDQGWARDAYTPLWNDISKWMPLPPQPTEDVE